MSLVSVVIKVFEKLVNNRIPDHLEKCCLIPDFQYGFSFSRSTANLLKVALDRIARDFNKSRATQTVHRVWYDGLLYKLKSDGILGEIFGLISFSVQDSFRWFWMGIHHKNMQLMLEFLKAPFLILHFFLLHFNNGLPDNICNTLIYADDITLYSQVSSGIWSVATTRIDFWTWIWSMRHCGLGLEVACWFQCWKNSTGFVCVV